jgi:hypothetical protein
LAVACALAVLAVDLPKVLKRRGNRDPRGRVELAAAWWRAFEAFPDHKKKVLCKLEDGTMIRGWLFSYSHQLDENVDRDIILSPPLKVQSEKGTIYSVEYGSMVISARRILYLHVDYIPD